MHIYVFMVYLMHDCHAGGQNSLFVVKQLDSMTFNIFFMAVCLTSYSDQ